MKIYELTKILRAKNAGPFITTFDLFFDSKENYQRAKDSGLFNKEYIAGIYNIKSEDIFGIYFVDEVKGIKISIPKPAGMASGDLYCRDLFGAQQHIPLLNIDIP